MDSAPRQIQPPVQQPHPSMMDKNVSLNLRTVLSLFAFLLFMSGSFLVGRYVFPAGGSIDSIGPAAVVETDKATEDAEPAEESEAQAELVAPENKTAEPAAPEPAEEAPAAEATPTAPEAEPSTPTGAVVTSYSNVQLSFTKVPSFAWYEEDGYGKITTIWYTIVNNEDGTIKPEKFRIRLEGYDEQEDVKFADVPGTDKEIDSKETASHGFDKLVQYSNTKTDPSNLKVTLDLLDADSRVIATVSQEFNLK